MDGELAGQLSGSARSISNQQIFDIRKQTGSDELVINVLIADHGIDISNINRETLRKKIGALFSKIQTLKKQKRVKQIEDTLERAFELPVSYSSPRSPAPASMRRALTSTHKKLVKTSEKLSLKEEELKTKDSTIVDLQKQHALAMATMGKQCTNLQQQFKELSTDSAMLEAELAEVRKENIKTERENQLVKKKLEKKQEKLKTNDIKQTNRTIKRHRETIDNLKSDRKKRKIEFEALSEEFKRLQHENSTLVDKVNELRKTNINHLKAKSRLKLRLQSILNARLSSEELQKRNTEQESALKEMQEYIEFIEDESSAAPSAISSFEDGRYTSEVREVCMTLLTECGVSIKKLPRTVEVVLTRLAGTNLSKTPSSATLSRMLGEANIVAQSHVAHEILSQADPSARTGSVLHQDATTKHHKHFEGMQVTLPDGKQLTLGLRQVAGGDAATYAEAFDDIINDLAKSVKMDEAEARNRLITSFKAFMNDRCAVNGVFSSQIEKLRQTLLPAVIDNFHSLDDDEKKEIVNMGHFACKLHLLSNFASACETGAAAIEECFVEGKNPHSKIRAGSSEAVNVVMTSAKAFAERGCDKSGVNSWFEAFLQGRGRCNYVKAFLGHRFNMLFTDAAAVFYHREDIMEFLEKWPNPNQLLQCVKFGIKEDGFMSVVRALGIIGKLLTEPFHRILNSGISILQCNSVLATLHSTLTKWMEDGSSALQDQVIFDTFPSRNDSVYQALFKCTDPEFNSLTALSVEVLAAHILIILERQSSDQLPGGELYAPSSAIERIAMNVPATNLVSESDMAALDNLMKTIPKASTSTYEAKIMWKKNKPALWLESLSPSKKRSVLESARKQETAFKKLTVQRKKILKETLMNKLKKKQEEQSKKDQRKIDQKLQATANLEKSGGLWKEEEVAEKIKEYNSMRAKRDALRHQILFWKTVIKGKGEKELFTLSTGGKQRTLTELEENLKKIIAFNNSETSDIQEDDKAPLKYKPKSTALSLLQKAKKVLMSKRETANLKRNEKSK